MDNHPNIFPTIFYTGSKYDRTLAAASLHELVVIEDNPYIVLEDPTVVINRIKEVYRTQKKKLPTVIKLKPLFKSYWNDPQKFDLNTEIMPIKLEHFIQIGPFFANLLTEINDLRSDVDRLEDELRQPY